MQKGRHKNGHSLLSHTNFVVEEKIQSAAIRAGPTASRRGRHKRKAMRGALGMYFLLSQSGSRLILQLSTPEAHRTVFCPLWLALNCASTYCSGLCIIKGMEKPFLKHFMEQSCRGGKAARFVPFCTRHICLRHSAPCCGNCTTTNTSHCYAPNHKMCAKKIYFVLVSVFKDSIGNNEHV